MSLRGGIVGCGVEVNVTSESVIAGRSVGVEPCVTTGVDDGVAVHAASITTNKIEVQSDIGFGYKLAGPEMRANMARL